MYRLISSDLDGTLLNSSHQLSEKNEAAILGLVGAGRVFSLSTGRPLQGVTAIIDLFEADLPFAIYNGAIVITSKSKQVLYEGVLDGNHAEEIIRFGFQHGATQLVYKSGVLFVSEINKMVQTYMDIVGVTPVVTNELIKVASDGVTKVIWRDRPDKIAELQAMVGQHVEGKANCCSSSPFLLEFFDVDSSKGVAMQVIGAHYNIAQSEMMAIGDGFNDISMIEYAALGVAMGNAPQQVKDVADVVTLTNDEDGAAEAIYKYAL